MVIGRSRILSLAPVFDGYLADPFVWEHNNVYFAIGTGAREATGHTAEKVFPLLRSTDFVNWHLIGDAMVPPPVELGDTFWAPAVAFFENRFYLYYSVGQEDKNHQLRVAASSTPEGPYRDLGLNLIDRQSPPFCIDPHPFQDTDGQWYLFYACDFLDCDDHTRAGTALMARRMISMTRLEETGHVILRARSDWQRFQTGRQMYGATWDWHTLEGPCVVRHADHYYCFYSGGCWQNDSYGVDYGISESVLGPYSDSGNEAGPRVLRTQPRDRIGPGHNSWIVGPSGSEYLVYHAWDRNLTARRMFIEQLLWTPQGPRLQSGNSLH